VIGERVKQARELRGLTQEQLAEQVGVKQATIALIERDALNARDEVASGVAEATGFPVEFFDLPVEKEFPLGSLVYRKFARMKAEHKKLSHRVAQQAFELSEFLAAQLKPIPVRLPRVTDEDPETAARLVRNALGVEPTIPIQNLIQKLERLGVRVFMLPEDIPDLDAFSILVEGRIPVIALNPERPGDRQNFSLAHELGHLVLHYPLAADQDEMERQANRFAAELLMPDEAMRTEMTPPVTLSSLAELKARWRVSIAALLQRAKQLDIITEGQYLYLRKQITQAGWAKREPVEIAADRPRALRRMAEVAFGEPVNPRRIAKQAKRPPFLVARLLDTPATATTDGRVLGFRSKEETTDLAEA
jgi:Zn-dependent peptidase ImmA (M78 family)/transcriptional regulator with XRE-family HTH domain